MEGIESGMSLSISGRSSKVRIPMAERRARADQRRAVVAANRAARLARAKQLLRNRHYPSDDVLYAIARLFAKNWNK